MFRKSLPGCVLLITVLALPAAGLGQGQASGQVYGAQYSVPFGVISGKLMLLGSYLVFVDEGRPESSFVITRSQIAALSVEGSTINVDTTGPISDREGPRTLFSFRLNEGTEMGPMIAWHRGNGGTAASLSADPTGDVEMVYTAKHDHRIGSCRGQLIIRDDTIAYDSLTDLGHSRRWRLIDIKEFKQKNPYQLSVEGFSNGTYNFELQGRGMEPADFTVLVQRITTARTGS